MEHYKGDIRILSIKVDDDYVPLGCLVSNGIEESVEMLDTTTRTSYGWKTSVPTTQEYRIPFEAVQSETDTVTLSYADLKQLKRARTKIEWQISGGGLPSDNGYGYITGLNEANTVGELLLYNGEIYGYGEPVLVFLVGDLFQNGNVMLFQNGNEILFN